jgi:hypothetical protein
MIASKCKEMSDVGQAEFQLLITNNRQPRMQPEPPSRRPRRRAFAFALRFA